MYQVFYLIVLIHSVQSTNIFILHSTESPSNAQRDQIITTAVSSLQESALPQWKMTITDDPSLMSSSSIDVIVFLCTQVRNPSVTEKIYMYYL